MALFEEPLAAHTKLIGNSPTEPLLVFSMELDRDGKPYAFVCNAEGELFKISFDLITVDWRWLPTDERWYDLVDIKAMQDRKEAPDGADQDEG